MSAILVVDDDPQVLEVVGEMLRLEGYDVATAADGREAVAKFRSQAFDLVITDLIMPEKEGLETIAEMKSLRKAVPVIAMSAAVASARWITSTRRATSARLRRSRSRSRAAS